MRRRRIPPIQSHLHVPIRRCFGDLVAEKLVACANLVPLVRSIYAWEGKVNDDEEVLCLLKTTSARFEAMKTRLVALHPYDCPEVIAANI